MPTSTLRSAVISLTISALLISQPLFAFQTPLSNTAVREAYFLGQRHDQSVSDFFRKDAKSLPDPKYGPISRLSVSSHRSLKSFLSPAPEASVTALSRPSAIITPTPKRSLFPWIFTSPLLTAHFYLVPPALVPLPRSAWFPAPRTSGTISTSPSPPTPTNSRHRIRPVSPFTIVPNIPALSPEPPSLSPSQPPSSLTIPSPSTSSPRKATKSTSTSTSLPSANTTPVRTPTASLNTKKFRGSKASKLS